MNGLVRTAARPPAGQARVPGADGSRRIGATWMYRIDTHTPEKVD